MDKITEMGYAVRENTVEYITIEQKEDVSDLVILLDRKTKSIYSFLRPNNVISNLDDVCLQYASFRKMKADAKELSALLGYDIIQ